MTPASAPTIAKLARDWGENYTTLRARLLKVHEQDMADAMAQREVFVPWLYRFPIRRWRVNLSRFYRLHPSAKDVRPLHEIDGEVVRMKRQIEIVDTRTRETARRVAAR